MKKQSQNKTDALTNNDLEKIGNLLDDRLAPVATKEFVKQEITGSEQRLKTHINEGIETVMVGIDNITKMLVEKERVDKLEKWVQRIGEKVGVRQEK